MKKILLVPDVPGWAFDILADSIIKYNTKFEIDKKYISGLQDADFVKYDLVHVMGWSYAQRWLHHSNLSTDVSACWYKYRGNPDQNLRTLKKFKNIFGKSLEIVEDLKPVCPNIIWVPDAIDYQLHKIKSNKQTPIKIGWIGNIKTGNIQDTPYDIKGYNHILLPLLKRLKGQVDYRIIPNDYTIAIPHEDIIKFYQSLDLFLCTSWSEGTPQPALEALASGVPLISTRVGIIPQVGEKFNHLLKIVDIKNKNNWRNPDDIVDEFYKHILCFIKDHDYIKQRSQDEEIFSWSENIKKLTTYFTDCLRGQKDVK